MSGSKKNSTERGAILVALKQAPSGGHFEWDGKDEDERPATAEEMASALVDSRRRRGRPAGSTKEQVAIRFDADVVAALRESGPGWQTRVSDAVTRLVKAGRL